MMKLPFIVIICLFSTTPVLAQRRHPGGICDTTGYQAGNGYTTPGSVCAAKGVGGISNTCGNTIELICPLIERTGVDEGAITVHVWDGSSSASVCARIIAQDFLSWGWSYGAQQCNDPSNPSFIGSRSITPTRTPYRDARYDWYELVVTLPAVSSQTSYLYGYHN